MGMGAFFRMVKVFWNWTVLINAWLCDYTENHWIKHFKMVNFTVCGLSLNIAVILKKSLEKREVWQVKGDRTEECAKPGLRVKRDLVWYSISEQQEKDQTFHPRNCVHQGWWKQKPPPLCLRFLTADIDITTAALFRSWGYSMTKVTPWWLAQGSLSETVAVFTIGPDWVRSLAS